MHATLIFFVSTRTFLLKKHVLFPKWPISELRWLATRNGRLCMQSPLQHDFYISAACSIMNLNSLQILLDHYVTDFVQHGVATL